MATFIVCSKNPDNLAVNLDMVDVIRQLPSCNRIQFYRNGSVFHTWYYKNSDEYQEQWDRILDKISCHII